MDGVDGAGGFGAGSIIGAVIGTFFGTLCFSAIIASLLFYCYLVRRRLNHRKSDINQREKVRGGSRLAQEYSEIVVCASHSSCLDLAVKEGDHGGLYVERTSRLSGFVRSDDRLVSVTISLEESKMADAMKILGQIPGNAFKLLFRRHEGATNQGRSREESSPGKTDASDVTSKCRELPTCFFSRQVEETVETGNCSSCSAGHKPEVDSSTFENVGHNITPVSTPASDMDPGTTACDSSGLGDSSDVEGSPGLDSASRQCSDNDMSTAIEEWSTVVTVDEVTVVDGGGDAVWPFGDQFTAVGEWQEPWASQETLNKERASKGGMSYYFNLQDDVI